MDFNHAVTVAKELARDSKKIVVVMLHGESHEVVCEGSYDHIFKHHGLPKVATVTPGGRVVQE